MAVVLFDGVCNLCNGAVGFIIARDPAGYFRFAPLSSAAGESLLRTAGVTSPLPDSVILIEEGRVRVRSDAALHIVRRLRFPWPLVFVLAGVPRRLRDWVYDWVARNRYGWFGTRGTCMIPGPSVRDRFLP